MPGRTEANRVRIILRLAGNYGIGTGHHNRLAGLENTRSLRGYGVGIGTERYAKARDRNPGDQRDDNDL
jgi:hypothetical protein